MKPLILIGIFLHFIPFQSAGMSQSSTKRMDAGSHSLPGPSSSHAKEESVVKEEIIDVEENSIPCEMNKHQVGTSFFIMSCLNMLVMNWWYL